MADDWITPDESGGGDWITPNEPAPAQSWRPQQEADSNWNPFKRAAHWAAQNLPEVNLPFIGTPSAMGMAQGLAESAKSAYTLPGDVYAGRVDPLSEAGIGRAANMAMLTQLPTPPSVARRAATGAPLAAEKIEAQATKGYEAAREAARATEMGGGAKLGEYVHDKIVDQLHQIAPRETLAESVYSKLSGLKRAKDVGDLIEMRQAIGKIAREGDGSEIRAAMVAKGLLDQEIDSFIPGMSERLIGLDKNYAIAGSVQRLEEGAAAQRTLADSGGPREGTRLREFGRRVVKSDKPYITPEVRAAGEELATGNRGKQAIAQLDPARGGLPMYLQILGNLGGLATGGVGHIPTMAMGGAGYITGKVYDRAQRAALERLSEAMRREAPAAIEAGGFTLPTNVGIQPRLPTPLTYPPLMLAPPDRRQRY
jgi:hypothetical protein